MTARRPEFHGSDELRGCSPQRNGGGGIDEGSSAYTEVLES